MNKQKLAGIALLILSGMLVTACPDRPKQQEETPAAQTMTPDAAKAEADSVLKDIENL